MAILMAVIFLALIVWVMVKIFCVDKQEAQAEKVEPKAGKATSGTEQTGNTGIRKKITGKTLFMVIGILLLLLLAFLGYSYFGVTAE